MTRKSVTVCRTSGCPNLRPCPVDGHEPKAWAGSDRRKRLPADWPRRRARILHRDPICQLRYAGICTIASTEVDHRIAGDDHADTNLQGVCHPCHTKKTSEEKRHG